MSRNRIPPTPRERAESAWAWCGWDADSAAVAERAQVSLSEVADARRAIEAIRAEELKETPELHASGKKRRVT